MLAYTKIEIYIYEYIPPPPSKKSRIRETPTLSTDADSRTNSNLKRLRDVSKKKIAVRKICGECTVPSPVHPPLWLILDILIFSYQKKIYKLHKNGTSNTRRERVYKIKAC